MRSKTHADLLMGGASIAAHLGITKRQVFHLHDQNRLPTFHIGRSLCALKSDLDEWLQRQAAGAQKTEGKAND